MIVRYVKQYEERWDEFVLKNSVNGCFLQTRNFLNYHNSGKFVDHSLLFVKGDTIVAVLPANEIANTKELISHQGSTFGGIIVGEEFASITNYEWIFLELLEYLKKMHIERIIIRTSNWLYNRDDRHIELLDYYYEINGFVEQSEVGFFVDLGKLTVDFENQFATLKRRKLKKALKNNLIFKKLSMEEEISDFYDVLVDNMKKFDITPLHSLEEIIEFQRIRLKDIVSFYGVYFQNRMIAGSMVFNFNDKKVFHTQYLASRHDCLDLCPNEFLYVNLIKEALRQQYRFLSYGTSTLEHGAVLNKNLALYKEGFNTESYVNRTYTLEL